MIKLKKLISAAVLGVLSVGLAVGAGVASTNDFASEAEAANTNLTKVTALSADCSTKEYVLATANGVYFTHASGSWGKGSTNLQSAAIFSLSLKANTTDQFSAKITTGTSAGNYLTSKKKDFPVSASSVYLTLASAGDISHGGYMIKYNSQSSGFRWYASGQDAVYFYEKAPDATLQSISATLKSTNSYYAGDNIQSSDFNVDAVYDKTTANKQIIDGKDVTLSTSADGSNAAAQLTLAEGDNAIYVCYGGKVTTTAITINAKPAKHASSLKVTVPADYKLKGYYEDDKLTTSGIKVEVVYDNYPDILDDVTTDNGTTIKFYKAGAQHTAENEVTSLTRDLTYPLNLDVVATYTGDLSSTEVTGSSVINGIEATMNVMTLEWTKPILEFYEHDQFKPDYNSFKTSYNNPNLKGKTFSLSDKNLTMEIQGKGVITDKTNYHFTAEDNGKNLIFIYEDKINNLIAKTDAVKLIVHSSVTEFIWENAKTEFFVGDNFNLGNATAKLHYNNPAIKDSVLDKYDVTVYVDGVEFKSSDTFTAEQNGKEIYLEATDKFDAKIKSPVRILKINPVTMEINWTNPTTSYLEGSKLNVGNQEIKVTYSNGEYEYINFATDGVKVYLGTEQINPATYTLTVNDTAKDVKVEYTNKLYGASASTEPFAITVKEDKLVNYTKLTDITDLNIGDKVILAGIKSSSLYAMAETDGDIRAITQVNTEVDGSVNVRESSNVAKLEVEFADQAGNYSFLDSSINQYIGTNTTSNKMYNFATKDKSTRFTVKLDDNGYAVMNVNGRLLSFNSSASRFACYGSKQADFNIYIAQGDASKAAVEYATMFHKALTGFCNETGEGSDVTSIKNKWADLKADYNLLSLDSKKAFATDKDCSAAFGLYNIIVNKYKTENFAVNALGEPLQLFNGSASPVADDTMIITVVVVSIFAVSTIAFLAISKRRKVTK